MNTVYQTDEFKGWLKSIRDENMRAKITARILRLGHGNPGDVKPVGSGISEMRINVGPGYRLYYKQTGKQIVLLLCGGDKSTQNHDIKRAKEIASNI